MAAIVLAFGGCSDVETGSYSGKHCIWTRKQKCFDIYAAVDLYLAVYPTIVLFKLQLSLRKKLALSTALGVGFVSTIVAIYKTTRLWQIGQLASTDFSRK
ncbi:hypothetical protein DL767_010656 [Monosporascus sp. MG133]|nr:hypothetical protein DL767_010656 [Monosporascus sp. MG133]